MFARRAISAESFTHDLNFEACDAGVDPGIATTGGANRTRFNGAAALEAASGARIQHKRTGRTNALKSSIDMSDSTYWLQNAGGWWTSTASYDKAPPKRGAKVTKFVRTAAAAADSVFSRCNSLSLPAGARSGSIYIYVPSGQGITNYRILCDWQDVEQGAPVISTAFDQWVRIESTATLAAVRSFLDYCISVNTSQSPSAGFTFYAAAPQESDALTEWIPTGAAPVTVYDSYGLHNEPAILNGVRNSSGAGSVVGTPGTRPTYWELDKTAAQNIEIAGKGQEAGYSYTDVRFWSAANDRAYLGLLFDYYSNIPASPGQVWNFSCIARRQAGTLVGVHQLFNRSANGGSVLTDAAVVFTPPEPTVSLHDSRFGVNLTTPASTNCVVPIYVVTSLPVGPAFDYTIRFVEPNHVLASGMFMPVSTSAGALTASEARSLIGGAAFTQYWRGQGTFVVEFTPIVITHNECYWGIGQASVFNNSLYLVSSSGRLYLIGYSAGVNTIALDLGAMTAGTRHKVAISIKSGEVAARLNGGAEQVSSGALPAVIDVEGLLTSPWSGGSGGVNAYMHRRRYRPAPGRGDLYQLTA